MTTSLPELNASLAIEVQDLLLMNWRRITAE
jgi:hypothetical protein